MNLASSPGQHSRRQVWSLLEVFKFYAERLLRISANLRGIADYSLSDGERGINQQERESLIDRVEEVEPELKYLALDVSLVAISKFKDGLSSGTRIKRKDVCSELKNLLDGIDNELSTKFIFGINAKENGYYTKPREEKTGRKSFSASMQS